MEFFTTISGDLYWMVLVVLIAVACLAWYERNVHTCMKRHTLSCILTERIVLLVNTTRWQNRGMHLIVPAKHGSITYDTILGVEARNRTTSPVEMLLELSLDDIRRMLLRVNGYHCEVNRAAMIGATILSCVDRASDVGVCPLVLATVPYDIRAVYHDVEPDRYGRMLSHVSIEDLLEYRTIAQDLVPKG